MGEEIGGKLLRELGIKKLKIFFESCDSPTTALQAAATRDEKGLRPESLSGDLFGRVK